MVGTTKEVLLVPLKWQPIHGYYHQTLFRSWFENWLVSHLPKLLSQSKWLKNEHDVCIGDVVLFLKNDNPLNDTYQYGVVKELFPGNDGKTRKVTVPYVNASETTPRETLRAVRELVVILKEEEQNIFF